MNTVVIIQARMGSTRLPGKVAMMLGGLTVLERVVAAAIQIEGVDDVTVAWPESAPEVREDDVLGRYAVVARAMEADVIVRLTADCPFFDPQVGSLILREYRGAADAPAKYVSNVWPRRTWPDGMDIEVFSRAALEQAHRQETDPRAREHVGPAVRACATLIRNVELPVDWSHIRLTLDTPEDLTWLTQCLNAPRS